MNRNETTATTRAQALARQALNDDASFKRLRTEGAALRDAEVAALAFGIDDV